MNHCQEKSVTSSAGFPLEVYIFKNDGQYYAFDVRNFSILRINALGAAVLSRMKNLSFDNIMEELDDSFSSELVRAHYLKYLECIKENVFSTEPLPTPKRPPFYRLVLMLAGGCNMGCSYCFEKNVPVYQDPNLLSREQAEKTLDWFFRYHEGEKAHLQLYGGEPLLNWPVLKYVIERAETWAKEKNVHLTKYLITNGTLLNTVKIVYLKAHDVTIQVSVDGDPDTHDRNRVFKSGRPTMACIKPNIDKLIEQGADFNLRAVLTSKNIDPESVVAGLKSYGAERVSFEVVATDNPDVQLCKQDWQDFNERNKQYLSRPNENWSQLPDEIKKTIIKLCECHRTFYRCAAGLSEVTVSPDGNIYDCQRLYRDSYSKVSEDRGPADLDSQFLTAVDDRLVCKDCWARYLCGGGCMHQSQMRYAKPNTESTLVTFINNSSVRALNAPFEVDSSKGEDRNDPLPDFCIMQRNIVEQSILKICDMKARVKEN